MRDGWVFMWRVGMAGAIAVNVIASASISNEPSPLVRIESPHLPNAWRVHPRVLSGGQPDGEAGFAELKALGVKTIISVDGARPDIAAARKYGIRYVHLPHGYDGIPDDRVWELAKAVRGLEGPIYIHCHHGKHRSPAAAGAACVAGGLIPARDAVHILTTAGTSEHYRGLYETVRTVQQVDPRTLDSLNIEFPETVELPPFAQTMVAMEHLQDQLRKLSATAWQPPAAHPDLDPAHQALLLRELFTELLRTGVVEHEPDAFQRLVREGEAAGAALEILLRTQPAARHPGWRSEADAAFTRITANCARCHQQYRDVPISEKPPRAKPRLGG